MSAQMPREISSLSANVKARGDRFLVVGIIPPLSLTIAWIDAACLPSERPMSLNDSPSFHLRHSIAFCSGDSPRLLFFNYFSSRVGIRPEGVATTG
jgi:hypothetical protein